LQQPGNEPQLVCEQPIVVRAIDCVSPIGHSRRPCGANCCANPADCNSACSDGNACSADGNANNPDHAVHFAVDDHALINHGRAGPRGSFSDNACGTQPLCSHNNSWYDLSRHVFEFDHAGNVFNNQFTAEYHYFFIYHDARINRFHNISRS
jgi:hypothetical protein